MGCKGSKAQVAETAVPTDTGAAPEKTLLDGTGSADKPEVASESQTFSITIDSFDVSACLKAVEDAAGILQVTDLQGGLGAWNEREGTEKVQKGDFVVKVRAAARPASPALPSVEEEVAATVEVPADQTEWVTSDAKLLFQVLEGDGPFEMEIKRVLPSLPPTNTQEEVPAAVAAADVPQAEEEQPKPEEVPAVTAEVQADKPVDEGALISRQITPMDDKTTGPKKAEILVPDTDEVAVVPDEFKEDKKDASSPCTSCF